MACIRTGMKYATIHSFKGNHRFRNETPEHIERRKVRERAFRRKYSLR